jgi:HlyD family secretion protein
VADIALEYDDLLDAGGASWRRRLIAAGAAILIAAIAAYFAWNHWMNGGTSAAPPVFTEATVGSGNVTKTISTSGTVSASATSNLNFATAEKVTKVNVVVGQAVKQGDVLAEVDATDAQNALRTAQASLASANANLQQTLAGSTASQLASADQSVVQAQTSYTNAANALQTLKDPPKATDLEAAQQAVTAAQAQLQTAQQAQSDLYSNAQKAIATAQTGVQSAQTALTSAEQAVNNASENEQLAQSTLLTAETSYCTDPDPSSIPAFCSVTAAPISITDANIMVTVSAGADVTRGKAAQNVLSSDNGYRSSVSASQSATNALTTAQNNLTSANAALATAQASPTQAQIAAANSAVSAAQSALDTANANLATLQAGPTQAQLASAQGAVDQAAASLKSAQASRDQAYAGSTAAQIQSARSAVQQAQVNVDNAQKGVDNTKLTAPFDGTVSALNVQVGDIASAGGSTGSSSTGAAIVLNTPNQLVLNLTIAETDYPSVKVGDTGTVTFSALTGEIFPFVIDSIGANPTTTQGVVTYPARAHLVTGQQAAQILSSLANFGGRNRQGAAAGATPGADATPGAARTPRAARTPSASGTPGAGVASGAAGVPGGARAGGFAQALANQQQPAPGMSATAIIIVDQRTNVITVPLKAVQTKNRQTVVTIKNADGSTQDVPVVAGLSDATNTEITSGLTEGQTIEVPGATTTTAAAQALPATGGFGRGGGGGGAFFGGGGGGGRAAGD